jgi:hypothetical protein
VRGQVGPGRESFHPLKWDENHILTNVCVVTKKTSSRNVD